MSVLTLYFDESGSRFPGHRPDPSRDGRDWFALGGFIVRKEDEGLLEFQHATFCKTWKIAYPLHLTDMRSKRKKFAWLGTLDEGRLRAFWKDYHDFLVLAPVIGIACVIDRPGYLSRGYFNTHSDKWKLCRSAFDILVERSVKIARFQGRRLAVVFETDNANDKSVRGYFKNLQQNGLGFNQARSSQYEPLSADDFRKTLTTIEWKEKSNIMLQIADSYVYAMARGGYDDFGMHTRLMGAHKIAVLWSKCTQVSALTLLD